LPIISQESSQKSNGGSSLQNKFAPPNKLQGERISTLSLDHQLYQAPDPQVFINILGSKLDHNRKLHNFFISMSEEGSNVKWCKLNRNSFKAHISSRYGKKVMERMMYFLDTNFGIFLRSPFDHYSKMLKEFVKAGPIMWRRFAYQAFNISTNDRLCDHDMFTLLE
jgi:hypothetical protein